jgi:hypothetical protein
MINENLYIYAIDEEGDLVFVRKFNKHVVIGGKEEKSIITTTDIPENAQNFNETSDAKDMIEHIQNGDVVFDDEFVDTENLKLAYKDKYGNFYDRLTDKVVYINDDGDEIGESMEMEFSEAKQILNESGYQLIDENYDTDVSGTLYKSKLLGLLSKLKRNGYEIDSVVPVSENENDYSAEYNIYFSKSGVGFKLNLDIYEGKHTSYYIKNSDTNEVIENGEGRSFMSAISTIDFAGLSESTQIDEALEGPATSKQLWTLYKLTKKDYRGQDLSKEDAFKMIGELLKNKENGSTENKETPVKKAPKTAKPKINDNPLVKVGDIFSFSFGYDMTINQYYKVLSTKGKKAQVVEIGKKWVSGDPGYTGEVVPVPEREIDEPITALIKDDGNIRIKMYGRYHTAYPDSGKPSYENHMD